MRNFRSPPTSPCPPWRSMLDTQLTPHPFPPHRFGWRHVASPRVCVAYLLQGIWNEISVFWGGPCAFVSGRDLKLWTVKIVCLCVDRNATFIHVRIANLVDDCEWKPWSRYTVDQSLSRSVDHRSVGVCAHPAHPAARTDTERERYRYTYRWL